MKFSESNQTFDMKFGDTQSGGQDGFSPIANVTETDDGAIISITDKNGTTSATVKNGKDGLDGKNGTDGKDGVDGKTPVKGVDYFDGKDGKDGVDGYTPIRGVDYFTPEDVQEIVDEVKSSEGVYELIEEITTTEELTSLNRTAHPNGTPYNFKAVYVAMVVPVAPTAGNINIYSRKSGSVIGLMGLSALHATASRIVNYYTHQLHGLWLTRGGVCGGNYGSSDTHYFKDVPNLVVDIPVIDRLDISVVTSGTVIPAGTNIKIYGVRA